MGRPKKYSTAEERHAARKQQKLAWFHRNSSDLKMRRRRNNQEKPRKVLDKGLARGKETVLASHGRKRTRKAKTKLRGSDIVTASTVTLETVEEAKPIPMTDPPLLKTSETRTDKAPFRTDYWVTQTRWELKKSMAQFAKNAPRGTKTRVYTSHCSFWENVIDTVAPRGLRDWGVKLFGELTTPGRDSKMDPTTTAKQECVRLARSIQRLEGLTSGLSREVFEVDPFGCLGLAVRAEKLSRKASLLSNILDELILLYDDSVEGLIEAERDRILNYQIFVL